MIHGVDIIREKKAKHDLKPIKMHSSLLWDRMGFTGDVALMLCNAQCR